MPWECVAPFLSVQETMCLRVAAVPINTVSLCGEFGPSLFSSFSGGSELEYKSSLTGDHRLKVQAAGPPHHHLPHLPTCQDVTVEKGGSVSNKANKAPLPLPAQTLWVSVLFFLFPCRTAVLPAGLSS